MANQEKAEGRRQKAGTVTRSALIAMAICIVALSAKIHSLNFALKVERETNRDLNDMVDWQLQHARNLAAVTNCATPIYLGIRISAP